MTILEDILKLANPEKAKLLMRFFKTGKGQYGDGDVFLGIMVPKTREVVKKYVKLMTPQEIVPFLQSKYHEVRLFGLLCWVSQYDKGDEQIKHEVFTLYLKYKQYVNNWDLVDLSAATIMGDYATKELLETLADSESVWDRRIAMLTTFRYIRNGESELALHIAGLLLHDKHDLIQKAVGWMLREVGKRCDEQILLDFLDTNASEMPRTMLRYSLEKLSDQQRIHYLAQ